MTIRRIPAGAGRIALLCRNGLRRVARLDGGGPRRGCSRQPSPTSMNTDSFSSPTTGWPGATRLRPAIAALAAGLSLSSPAAGADAELPIQQLTAFEVVGSRIKRLDFESPLPVISFSREEISRTGVTDLQQFIRKLPQNSLGYTNEAVFGFTPGAAGANLRGLGVEYTLTLVN
ncbi:MAG: hypothetical protein FJ399_21485, partial [Verrucomicrobia bacterium]|nr:hypothetical protein [Verrucomicrobiota bacterium]